MTLRLVSMYPIWKIIGISITEPSFMKNIHEKNLYQVLNKLWPILLRSHALIALSIYVKLVYYQKVVFIPVHDKVVRRRFVASFI